MAIGERLLQRGWRHVGAPGLAMDWDPAMRPASSRSAAWHPVGRCRSRRASQRRSRGTHRPGQLPSSAAAAWSSTARASPHDPHTGTQHLVVQVARELANTRPKRHVVLAVPDASIAAARVGGRRDRSTVSSIADRRRMATCCTARIRCCSPPNCDFVTDVGRRRVIGQLDMIGFSNPLLPPVAGAVRARPKPATTSHATERRCHVHLGLRARRAPSPNAPTSTGNRLHVVSCGADPPQSSGTRPRVADRSRAIPALPVGDVLAQEPLPRHLDVRRSRRARVRRIARDRRTGAVLRPVHRRRR